MCGKNLAESVNFSFEAAKVRRTIKRQIIETKTIWSCRRFSALFSKGSREHYQYVSGDWYLLFNDQHWVYEVLVCAQPIVDVYRSFWLLVD